MEKCSISAERSFGKFEYDLQYIFVSLTMTYGPYLKTSNIFLSDVC